MTDFLSLIRPDLKDIKPYVSAASLSKGALASIRLDANENPWPPLGKIGEICDVNRYATFEEEMLYQRIADVLGITPEQIYLGRGSSEAIDLLIRLFCVAGQDEILICPPTFSMYQVTARVQGAKIISVPLLENGQLDLPEIEKNITDNTKLVFIPAPNAPMGHMMNKEDILALCKMRENKSIIIADEAYIEFTDEPEGMMPEQKDNENLVVLRTFSKAHAIAGERIGMALGHPELIHHLKNISAPYCLAQSSIKAALDALTPAGLSLFNHHVETIKEERERLVTRLAESSLVERVFPTVTNFMLIQATDLEALNAALRKFGIRARPNVCAIPNTLRISIGSPEDNSNLLEALGVKDEGPYEHVRTAQVTRETSETCVHAHVTLDRPRVPHIDTGIGFFDHMLAQIASHGEFGLTLTCKGDLHVDQHHTVEDCALALGSALHKALGDRAGIERFGFTAPLDEALATVSIDLSGRPHLEYGGTFHKPLTADFDTEMVPHFFRSMATALGATIHISVRGENTHHMIEAIFKSFGRALGQAIRKTGGTDIPSTKGVL